MRSILIVNAKGGCGKTTLATNLASNYALQGHAVVMADFDPQGSTMEWIAARPADRPPIVGYAAWREAVRAMQRPDYLIMDAPAGVSGRELTRLVRNCDTVLVPVLPSPIDIRAAARFMRELLLNIQVAQHPVKISMVANRVRENTVVFQKLQRFLRSLDIPFLTTLRETQHYIRAAQTGLGIFDMVPSTVATDLAQWHPLLEWIETGQQRSAARIAVGNRSHSVTRESQ